MKRSKLTWEEVIKFEEIKGYGQQIWRHNGQYYLVADEGGIAEQRVVYELPLELFQLIESGEKNLVELHFRLKNDAWPPNMSQEEANKLFWRKHIEVLKNNAAAQRHFTRQELEELLPEGSKILASSDS
ncbi:hypothetical protein [Gemella haemolysans]|uniref:Uncharacterized protein n=2 Tax=Gemella haemolysans TaxID=1379 RepID=A0AA87DUA6_9BACL|nr:hypothetical protein [Gemella haemolysans]EGF85729.1 hypothetical protein HMPREF0428_00571 [Gemella haemolysans M341]QIX87601.1 hypothetical protein FOC48_02000 [Gemella haemolysans]